jgi:hypothetical protein
MTLFVKYLPLLVLSTMLGIVRGSTVSRMNWPPKLVDVAVKPDGYQGDPRTSENGNTSTLETNVTANTLNDWKENYLNGGRNEKELDPWFIESGVDSEHGNLFGLFEALECNTIFQEARPIPSEAEWMLLRGAYQGVVGPFYSTIPIDETFYNGFHAPIYVDFVEGRGRGVVAKENIKAGSLIWTGEATACFRTGQEDRKFLASIPNGLACDVLVWAYIETVDSENQDYKMIQVDLDEASFFNTISGVDEKNVDASSGVALRDIRAGEELLVDYKDFAWDLSWHEFGL